MIAAAAIYALISVARPPQGTTITNEAISAYLFKTGQRVVSRSNMTETIVQNASIASMIDLTLSTQTVVGNGIDSCLVKAMVYDANGNAVPDGQPVSFTTTSGKFSNGSDTTYTLTTQGQATTWLKSDVLTGHSVVTTVGAMTLGVSGQTLVKQLPVMFYAAGLRGTIISGASSLVSSSSLIASGLQGTIVSAASSAVQGITVVAYDAASREVGRDTTGSAGSYFIPIEQRGDYTLAFRYKSSFDDDVVLYASASVDVPARGGVPAVSPLNLIVGTLVDATIGKPIRRSGVPVILYRTSSDNPKNGRAMPALQMTNDRGVFTFDSLAPGSSELNVIDGRYSGKLPVQHIKSGMFVIDANIALADPPVFEVVKSSNKRIAELGDAITYSVEIRNTSVNVPLVNVRLVDELPLAFVYAKNSARLDGIVLPDPPNNRKLEWLAADSLQPGRSIKVSYSVNIGAGALESDGINKAYAVAENLSGQTVRTAQATLQVTIRPGVFTDRGIVIGKVFNDRNENAQQDDGEQGIAGVELWMEDGTRIISGDDGKYSLPEVRPGQHVLRVNDLTLPYGSELLALKSESAGDGRTRFVRLTEGGIARADFYVKAPHQAALEATYARSISQSLGEPISARYILKLHDIGSPDKIFLLDTLPQGFYFEMNSITWRNVKLFPQSKYARTLALDFSKRRANSSDTIHLTIVGDSSAVGKPLASNGKLVLGYPQGKDAIFAVSQKYDGVESGEFLQGVAMATKEAREAKSDTVAQTQPTMSQQMKVADTTRIAAVGEQKKAQKKSGVKGKATSEAQAREPQTTGQVTQQQGAPVPDTTEYADTSVGPGENSANTGAGLIVVGIIFFSSLLFVYHRRKEGKKINSA